MTTTQAITYRVIIFISGPLDVIEQTCRSSCLAIGLCVTVTPTRFIYAGGEETGAEIGLLNYPRFPADPAEINYKARHLANLLLLATYQRSVLVVTPTTTEWITKDESK